RHHHEFEAAALDLRTAQRVAHDDEGRGKNEEGNESEAPRRHAFLQQPEAGGTLGEGLKAAGERAGEREADAEGEQRIQRIGRHLDSSATEPALPSQNRPRAATSSLIKG